LGRTVNFYRKNILNKSNEAPSVKLVGFCFVMHTLSNKDKTRGNSDLVMAGLVSAIPIVGQGAILLIIAATTLAMVRRLPRPLSLLPSASVRSSARL
jgi:hypothetical protein